jgi:hypothetical protein
LNGAGAGGLNQKAIGFRREQNDCQTIEIDFSRVAKMTVECKQRAVLQCAKSLGIGKKGKNVDFYSNFLNGKLGS